MLGLVITGDPMAPIRTAALPDLCQAMVESYAVNERMNQVILDHLDPAAWRARLSVNRGRTIAAIFSHAHNIRRKWLRLSAPHLELPAPLYATRCSQEEAKLALAESGARCCEMLAGAFTHSEPRVETFRRDGWAKPWPARAAMLAYMLSHDAHHRWQACMLARQLGFPLPEQAAYGIWAWGKFWKGCGFTHPR